MQSSAARPLKHGQGNSVMEQVATWEAQRGLCNLEGNFIF